MCSLDGKYSGVYYLVHKRPDLPEFPGSPVTEESCLPLSPIEDRHLGNVPDLDLDPGEYTLSLN